MARRDLGGQRHTVDLDSTIAVLTWFRRRIKLQPQGLWSE